jgi:hypothetical protein
MLVIKINNLIGTEYAFISLYHKVKLTNVCKVLYNSSISDIQFKLEQETQYKYLNIKYKGNIDNWNDEEELFNKLIFMLSESGYVLIGKLVDKFIYTAYNDINNTKTKCELIESVKSLLYKFSIIYDVITVPHLSSK